MKIVIIHNIYFPAGYGGAEIVVRESAKSLANNGHDVTILIPGKHNRRSIEHGGVTVIFYKAMHILHYLDLAKHGFLLRLLWHSIDMFNLAAYFQIKNRLKQLRPDTVICHNLTGVGFLIPSAIRALKIRFELYLHDIQLSIPSGILLYGEEKKAINSGVWHFLYENIVKSIIGSPDLVYSPSAWLLDFYIKKNYFRFSKTKILESKQYTHYEKKLNDGLTALQIKIGNESKISCVYIGKLEVHKGILWLIDLWDRLPRRFELSIYGTGSLDDAVSEKSSKLSNVSLYGYMNNEKLAAILQISDVLIMPSLCYENRPEVILDAYRAGVPVLASNSGGIPEIVIINKTGYLFTPGDAASFISIITQLHE